MLGHLGINVPDLVSAKRYYDAVMPILGFEVFFSRASELAYRPAGGKPGTFLFVYAVKDSSDEYSRHRAGLQHLAFMVKTRAEVDAAHRLVVELGSTVLHPPGRFPEYPQPYYATFWLDPFGFMFEAVCHHDRD